MLLTLPGQTEIMPALEMIYGLHSDVRERPRSGALSPAGRRPSRRVHHRQGPARRLTGRLSVGHPGYGFERHAGDGTNYHEGAIVRLGLFDQHRGSIKKLAELTAAGDSEGER